MSPKPTYTAENLYSGSGKTDLPHGYDIRQDNFQDCYYIAVLGATADRQPDRIKDAIRYDAAKGSFFVSLYEEKDGKPSKREIEVTQADIKENIALGGGGTADNTGKNTPIWPSVMEAAFAKTRDSNPADGLAEGYNAIGGGWSRQAMYALTGEKGTDIGLAEANTLGSDKVFERVRDAIGEGRAVTLSTDPEPGAKQDGLNDNHVYMVNRIYKDDAGKVMVELRNPYARNDYVGEGLDKKSATVDVKLDDLLSTGGFEEINIGPARAAGKTKAATESGKTGSANFDKLLDNLSDPAKTGEMLRKFAQSPEAESFRRDGKEQFQQRETQERNAAAPAQQEPAPAQEPPVRARGM
ncbi:C2 family cysteine protease [Pseudomonas sp. CGJS7]|uniref:C2 family cysteine protease n=1 Tax=Pseudomonas sp. CGJS7 TaxID=3109348 RepID=UPI00300967A3